MRYAAGLDSKEIASSWACPLRASGAGSLGSSSACAWTWRSKRRLIDDARFGTRSQGRQPDLRAGRRGTDGSGPMAVARLAAAGRDNAVAARFGHVPAARLAFALLVMALASALAGGALVAAQLPIATQRTYSRERAFVEPFNGLPPEGAAPSTPEQGELVLSFGGRVGSLGGDLHRMWLYADGRLIWKSNLEGNARSKVWMERFGGIEPTKAVIEQHLTAEGVDLIRSDVLASARVLGANDPRRGLDRVAPARCALGRSHTRGRSSAARCGLVGLASARSPRQSWVVAPPERVGGPPDLGLCAEPLRDVRLAEHDGLGWPDYLKPCRRWYRSPVGRSPAPDCRPATAAP